MSERSHGTYKAVTGSPWSTSGSAGPGTILQEPQPTIHIKTSCKPQSLSAWKALLRAVSSILPSKVEIICSRYCNKQYRKGGQGTQHHRKGENHQFIRRRLVKAEGEDFCKFPMRKTKNRKVKANLDSSNLGSF